MQSYRNCRFIIAAIFTVALFLVAVKAQAAEQANKKLPFIYTKWEHYTTKDGLPNDHIFAVKADGPYIWVGTEDGLARIDKRDRSVRSWKEADGLPFRVITAIDVDPKTGDIWLGMFGGGLARFSGGRFDHFHQLNSGLVNDVVYGLAISGDDLWVATTAGTSRYNIRTGQWTIYNEKNGPYEEIWNYGVNVAPDGKVCIAVWGSGVLEFDPKSEKWEDYRDPDGEMEIDLYRDDGVVHNIVTGCHYAGGVMWISSYFGASRYDGRNWRGYFSHDSGFPSDFFNNVKGRSADEVYLSSDKGLEVLTDFATDTWVTYSRDRDGAYAVVTHGNNNGKPVVVEKVKMDIGVPHSYVIFTELDGNDIWVGTSKGLGHGIGADYYARLRERSQPEVVHNARAPAPSVASH